MLVASTARYQTKQWCKDSLIMLASGAGTVLVAKLDVLLVELLNAGSIKYLKG